MAAGTALASVGAVGQLWLWGAVADNTGHRVGRCNALSGFAAALARQRLSNVGSYIRIVAKA